MNIRKSSSRVKTPLTHSILSNVFIHLRQQKGTGMKIINTSDVYNSKRYMLFKVDAGYRGCYMFKKYKLNIYVES